MKKIDKSKILSKNYKDWEKDLKKEEHPPYNSSYKKEYYIDIKMSLLYCQNGLCAYTEEVLCDPKFIKTENWDENQYKLKLEKKDTNEIKGDLEHFDESLKPESAFLWDNLFVVNTHNNCRIKGKKPIKNILKPDSKDYTPEKYLEFFIDTVNNSYIFIPNSKLSDKEQEDVKYMIETLGLNCVDYERKRQLLEWIDRYENGLPVDAYKYITAWSMILENLKDKDE
jgi:hypothetical protein